MGIKETYSNGNGGAILITMDLVDLIYNNVNNLIIFTPM